MKRMRKGDTVIVIAGKSKGHVGTIVKVENEKVLVKGANLVKKTVKANPQQNQPGAIKTKEMPIHVSNVAMYNQETKKADKVGFRFVEQEGKQLKIRYFKSTQAIIETNFVK